METSDSGFLYQDSDQCYTDDAALDLELQSMEERRKKLEVMKVHKHKITPPTEKYHAYKTRVNSETHIVRATEKDLYDALYEFYFGKKIKPPTLREAIIGGISSREKSGAIEYLTARHYLDDAEKYIFPDKIASKIITEISKSEIISFFEQLAGDGSKMLQSTISNVKTVINAAFEYANMIDGVDCIDVKRISIKDIKKRCYTNDNSDEVYLREEAERIIAYLVAKPKRDVYDYAIMLYFCLTTRVGEFRAITWEEDLDLDNMILHLQHQMVTKKQGNINRKTTDVNYMKRHSRSGIRDIEISKFAAWVFEQLYKINGNKKYILQSRGQYPITTNNFNTRLKKVCEEVGIRYRSSHKIRFYACSSMYEYNLPEREIQYRMGHSSVDQTRKYNRSKNSKLDSQVVNDLFGFDLPEEMTEN